MNWNELFIEPEKTINRKKHQPASYLRKEFFVAGQVKSVVLHITALGLYRWFLNGESIDDQPFMPGFTSYDKRLQYQTFNVTSNLTQGNNTLGVILGDGWYRGKHGIMQKRYVYGEKTSLLVILDIEYQDGSTEQITTDETWRATQNGPIRKSDLKDGEVYDATKEMGGWSSPGFDDEAWDIVNRSSYQGQLIPYEGERILEHETFQPRVLKTQDGSTVLDFGQNICGYVQFSVTGPTGHTVKLSHGETLDAEGDFSVKHLRQKGEFQQIRYTLKEGEQTYKPFFTMHGFQLVKVENWPGDVRPEDFTAIAVYSDLKETGFFECSNALVNKLVSNSRWSQKSNFLDVPTDNPTRERTPWTGDLGVFCMTACYLMDSNTFLSKWLNDLTVTQRDDGLIMGHIPSTGHDNELFQGSTAWSDVGIIVPWAMYQMYGDASILSRQYEGMAKWIGYQQERAKKTHLFNKFKRNPYRSYTIDTGFHFGDWNEPGTSMGAQLNRNLIKSDEEVATAYYAYCTGILAKIAAILGKNEEAEQYEALANRIKEAYRHNYTDNGIVVAKRHGKYVRPVAFDLLSEEEKQENMKILNSKVIANNYKIGTGFLSTPFLLPMLTDYGFVDTAYRILENTERPGWLYSIVNGATSIWESWDGKDEKGIVRDSWNQYAYGAVTGWLFGYSAGITALEPGFSKIRIRPKPGGSLDYVKCSFDSAAGEIKSEWTIQNDEFKLKVKTPTETEVELPDGSMSLVKEGSHSFRCSI
ncbi:MAG: family 78 glycoside hydrolase catalytic domain [Chloroflexota bacterium]